MLDLIFLFRNGHSSSRAFKSLISDNHNKFYKGKMYKYNKYIQN